MAQISRRQFLRGNFSGSNAVPRPPWALAEAAFASACTRCGDCLKACPEPRVLNFNEAARHGIVRSGECTNCAACIAVCPESSLRLALRPTLNRVHVPGTKPEPPASRPKE